MNHNLSDFFDMNRPVTVFLSSGEELSGLPVMIHNEFIILDCDEKRYYLPFPFIRFFFSLMDDVAGAGVSRRNAGRLPGDRRVSAGFSGGTFSSGMPFMAPVPASSHIKPLRNPNRTLKYFPTRTQLTELVSDWLSAVPSSDGSSEADDAARAVSPEEPPFDYPPNRHVVYEKYHEDQKTWNRIKSQYLNFRKTNSLKNLSRLAEEMREIAVNQPHSPELYEQAAWMAYLAGEPAEAADSYRAAFEVMPQPSLILSAARSARKAGRFAQAAVFYAVGFSLSDLSALFPSGGAPDADADKGAAADPDWLSFLDCVHLSAQLLLAADFLGDLYQNASEKLPVYQLLKKTVSWFLLKNELFDNAKAFLTHLDGITDKNIADGAVDPEVVSGLLGVAFRNAESGSGE